MADFEYPDAPRRPSLGRQIFSRIGQRNELAQDRQALARDNFDLRRESRRFDEDLKQKNYDLDVQEFDLKRQGADLELMKTQSAILAKRLEDARNLQAEKDAAAMLDALANIDVSSDTAQKQIAKLTAKYPRALTNEGVQKVLTQWNSDSEQFLKYRVKNLERQEQDERAAIAGEEANRLGLKPKGVRTTADGVSIDYEQPGTDLKTLPKLEGDLARARSNRDYANRRLADIAKNPGAFDAKDKTFYEDALGRAQADVDGYETQLNKLTGSTPVSGVAPVATAPSAMTPRTITVPSNEPFVPAPVATSATTPPAENIARINALKERLRLLNQPAPSEPAR